MGIKALGNPGDDFVNKLVRAIASDSTGLDATSPVPVVGEGMTATGGAVSDWTDPGPGNVYRSHVFTSTGTFVVSDATSDFGSTVDYLVVAGGGGGGAQVAGSFYSGAGGGGAGGLKTSMPGVMPNTGSALPVAAASYTVTIGAGGRYAYPGNQKGSNGVNSSLQYNGGTITCTGGGGGGSTLAPGSSDFANRIGAPGGSGGGAGGNNPTGSATQGDASPNSNPDRQGYPGTNITANNGAGGGGGGAGGAGEPAPDPYGTNGRTGGTGVQVAIAGPTATTFTGVGDKNPSNNQYQYFAGGGAGGSYSDTATGPTVGGGGKGGRENSTKGENAIAATGGGGGGSGGKNPGFGGNGASGIVVVRYQIGQVAANAKATGGAVSFYNNKTIHVFTHSGSFNVTSGPISAEFFIVAGGGGGGFDAAGGGGGGGIVYHPGLTVADGNYAVTIGAGGEGSFTQPQKGQDGSDSSIAFPTTYTAYRGGGGGSRSSSGGSDGGSGGGGARTSGSGGSAVQPASNPGATEYGNDGGTSGDYGAGGGGAGTAGQPYPSTNEAGWGGAGRQAPPSFRDPKARYGGGIPGGDPSGYDWGFSGGGGGGGQSDPAGSFGGSYVPGTPGRTPGGPYYGAGSGALDPPAPTETNTKGDENTGGGGGGGNNGPSNVGKNGGSGIVLIAYPS